jgi:tetratricopeptide (TPR) repeat protein
MYPMIVCAATAVLVAAAAQPVIDTGVCTNGMADEPVAACTRIRALNPCDAFAYNNRGLVSSRKGDDDRPIADRDQAIRLDPELALPYKHRGNAYNGKGDYDRADADQAIQLNPKYAAAYATRGEASEAKNEANHAIADFDQALKLDPSLADAQRGCARALLAKRSNLGAQTNAPTQYASGDCHVLI